MSEGAEEPDKQEPANEKQPNIAAGIGPGTAKSGGELMKENKYEKKKKRKRQSEECRLETQPAAEPKPEI